VMSEKRCHAERSRSIQSADFSTSLEMTKQENKT
jgi:hypothetical protein